MTSREDLSDAMQRSMRSINLPHARNDETREAGVPPGGWPEPQVQLLYLEIDGSRYYRFCGIRGTNFRTFPLSASRPVPTWVTLSWRPWCTAPAVDIRCQHTTKAEAIDHLVALHRRYGTRPDVEHFAAVELFVLNPERFNAQNA